MYAGGKEGPEARDGKGEGNGPNPLLHIEEPCGGSIAWARKPGFVAVGAGSVNTEPCMSYPSICSFLKALSFSGSRVMAWDSLWGQFWLVHPLGWQW